MNNNKEKIIKTLKKHRYNDYSYKSGRILGSMCTQPFSIAKKAYNLFLETNLGDPDLFPGSKKIENKYISFLKKLLNANSNSFGIIGSGGTESNITAIWIAKKLSDKKKVIVPESAHFSFEKIGSLMDVEIVSAPMNDDYTVNTDFVKKEIKNDVAAVVGIAGSTELGTIDNIPLLSDICRDEHVFLHVDAAFGGYVIPFMKKLGYKLPDFDFKLSGVSSISIDAHKMGCSAIPLGTLLVREKKHLDSISVKSHCVSSKTQSGILGTRSGGPVAAGFAVAEYLGFDGYKKVISRCLDNTYYLVDKIRNIGLKTYMDPVMNVVAVKLKKPDIVSKKLSDYNWRVNIMDRISSIRIVLMPHVSKKNIDEFIPVLEKVCKKVGEL